MKKLIVFDLDGTLNQTDLVSVPAQLKALEKRGVTDVTPEQIRATFGERPDEYVKAFLGEVTPAEARAYFDDVAAYENAFLLTDGRAYDGVPELLAKLKADGYRLATCSNSSLRYQSAVLDALGLIGYIDEIQELRPNMTKVETLALLLEREVPDFAVMVGDRIFDIEAGRANRLPTIGCRYGFNPAEAREADAVADHPAEIYHIVKRFEKNFQKVKKRY